MCFFLLWFPTWLLVFNVGRWQISLMLFFRPDVHSVWTVEKIRCQACKLFFPNASISHYLGRRSDGKSQQIDDRLGTVIIGSLFYYYCSGRVKNATDQLFLFIHEVWPSSSLLCKSTQMYLGLQLGINCGWDLIERHNCLK